MILPELLAELDARGVKIAVIDGKLRVDAPKNAFSDGLRAALVEHKAALLCRYAVAAGCAVNAETMPLQHHNGTMEPWQVALWADYPPDELSEKGVNLHSWGAHQTKQANINPKTETKGDRTMGATIQQTIFEVFEAGMYRAKLAAAALEESDYGPQVAVRFDLTEPGYENKSVRAWASAKLSGGKRPSKLYTWTSALLFNGKPLPKGFDLDIDNLLDRETLLVLDVVQKDGVDRNRVAQLLPLRRNGAGPVTLTPAPPAADERVILKPRPPLTAANAAGILAGGVPVNAAALPVPEDVPDWLMAEDEVVQF